MSLKITQWIRILLVLIVWTHIWLTSVATQTWCGKNYRQGQPVVPPKGAFEIYEELSIPHIAFKCLPRMHVYVESDGCDAASILLDTLVTSTRRRHSLPLKLTFNTLAPKHRLNVEIEGELFSFPDIPFNASNVELPISLCILQPRFEPYVVNCHLLSEEGGSYAYAYTTILSYLPRRASESVTTIDRKTGAMMIQSIGRAYEPIFPIGFYTDFGGYLASNLSILDELKMQGFNTIHPVPPFGDKAAFEAMLDYLDDIGMFLMYDMRHSYQNLETIESQVNALKDRKSLLLWYTADEPDGHGVPLDATRKAYALINRLDPYHPVSLALNCADYFFEDYVSGADIVMPDVYSIGNNVTFSTKYDTPCTTDFGCCGCDNCKGEMEDTSKRLDDARKRLEFLGWEKSKFIWVIPQAFGGEEFWSRPPSGREWLAQTLLGINHGARGIIPWIDPTPGDIKTYASQLALALPRMSPFLFNPNVAFKHSKLGRMDIGSWEIGSKILVVAVNPDYKAEFELLGHNQLQNIAWVMKENVGTTVDKNLSLQPLGSAIFIKTLFEDSTRRSTKNRDWLVEHNEL